MPAEGPGSSRGDLVRAQALAEGLRALGHRVEFVAAAASPAARTGVTLHRSLLRRLLPRRLALALRDLGRALHSRRHATRVATVARAFGAELIVETQVGGVASGERAARTAGLPLVLDDCSPTSEEIALGCGLPGLVRRGLARQLAAAAVVVAVTQASQELLLAEGAPAERIRIVPNGVDLALFPTSEVGEYCPLVSP